MPPSAPPNRVPLLAFDDLPEPTAAERAEYNSIRARLAKSETPAVLIVIASLSMMLSIVNYAMRPEDFPTFHLIDFGAGLAIVVVGLLLRRTTVRAGTARWACAMCMVALVFSLLVQSWVDPNANQGYALIAMCMVGPLTLAWSPFFTSAALTIGGVALVAARTPGASVPDVTFLAVTATVASAIMLMVRITSIRGQASAVANANAIATTDTLTGILNRRGLERMLPTLAATAKRLMLPVSVYFVDVDGLKAANDFHGHPFGDEILRCVAGAIRSTVREGDLVARWGGDEFVVVGLGGEADHTHFTERLCRSIRWSDIDLKRWDGVVSVGKASGQLDSGTIEQFVRRADADMYAKRYSRRMHD